MPNKTAKPMSCAAAAMLIASLPAMGNDLAPFDDSDSLLNPQWDGGFESNEPIGDVTSALNSSPPPSFIIVGDMNGDGSLTNGDINAFTMALTNPANYATTFPGLDANYIGDFNDDGLLTNGDIAGFVLALTSGETILKVSEQQRNDGNGSIAPTPTAFGAGIAALLTLASRRRRRSA